MLFGGKLRLSERMLAVPDHLGSFFPPGRDAGGSSGADSGEEMDTFLGDGVGSNYYNRARSRDRDGYCIIIRGDDGGTGARQHYSDDDDELRGLWDQQEEEPRQDFKKNVRNNNKVAVAPPADADETGPELESELSQKVINLEALQRIAGRGLPFGGSSRALVWKLLLGYLPEDRDSWDGALAEKRAAYLKLKSELILDPSRSKKGEECTPASTPEDAQSGVDGQLQRHEIHNGDHPLSMVKASVWHQYFQDSEITAQIDRDLQRTHPNLRFFSGDSTFSLGNRESMRNVLLLFAKLNPAIGYVQGMNEVLAPLYYVFSTDSDVQIASEAEADSFFCFVTLLSDSVDHFCPQLDNSPMGILSTLSDLSELLKANDEELWRHLEISNKVKSQFYAFRWITLLLTQDFDFHAILRIWDSLLSNPLGVQEMVLRVCCAMLLCVRRELLDGDFAANLKLLQHYPRVDVQRLLGMARDAVVVTPDSSLRRKSQTLLPAGLRCSSTN